MERWAASLARASGHGRGQLAIGGGTRLGTAHSKEHRHQCTQSMPLRDGKFSKSEPEQVH